MNRNPSNNPQEPLFDLIQDDGLSKVQGHLGLMPAGRGGLKRRAILYALLAWLPLVIASWIGSATSNGGPSPGEPLLGHFGIHLRCLVAIPLLVLAEGIARQNLRLCLMEFKRSGLVDATLEGRFDETVRGVVLLKRRVSPWIIIVGLVTAWTAAFFVSPNPDEVLWAGPASQGLAFGAWWFLLVTRPLFSLLLLAWVWRLTLVGILLLRISRLPLKLVVQHPDRMGGLGFLDRLPVVYSPFLFSVSVVVAGAWAHTVFYHNVTVPSLYVQMGALVLVLLIIGLAPLLVFTPKLIHAKRQALLDYGALLSRHGRLVDDRWIGQKRIPDDPILDAPELGPVADIRVAYEGVAAMRPAAINRAILLKIALPAALPLLVLVATQWPLKSILSKLLFTLL